MTMTDTVYVVENLESTTTIETHVTDDFRTAAELGVEGLRTGLAVHPREDDLDPVDAFRKMDDLPVEHRHGRWMLPRGRIIDGDRYELDAYITEYDIE